MRFYDITEEDRELIAAALDVLRRNADGNYHTVGCALKGKSGKIYTGVNCDGIHGSCAEFIAAGAARSAGEKQFDTIVAVHEKAPNKLFAPCGNCRQMLMEYSPDVKVILNDDGGKIVKTCVRDLLPFAWRPVD